MKWAVGYVGEEEGTEVIFETKDAAHREYHCRLERYRGTAHNKDPPDLISRPWMARADSDSFYVCQGIVQNVVPREGYFIVAVGPLIGDEPQQLFWHEGTPSVDPGDHIMYNHAGHTLPRREGLYAILPFKSIPK